MSVAVELARLGLSWGDLVQMRADLLAAIARHNRKLLEGS